MNKDIKYKRDLVVGMYKSHYSDEEIMKECDITWSDYYNLVAPCLEHNLQNVSDEQINIIISMYNSGVSTTKIGTKLGIHHKTVSEILKANNIKINQAKTVRKHGLDIEYFDKIDTPNKAYILGLLYADGYNNESKGEIRLSLECGDKGLLELISKELQYNKSLVFDDKSHYVSKQGFISKDMYSLIIYSRHMSNSLKKLGMIQNKSLVLSFPQSLDKQFYSHFIRGYFDGDGSYCHRYADGYGWRDLVTFTSTEQFCKKMKEIINSYSKAIGGGIYDASCHNGITKVLSFSGSKQVKFLLDYIYQDAELYLERKHDLYLRSFY